MIFVVVVAAAAAVVVVVVVVVVAVVVLLLFNGDGRVRETGREGGSEESRYCECEGGGGEGGFGALEIHLLLLSP